MTEVDGGYDFEFVDGELPHGHTCSICLLAMRNPVQTVCGHRFCETCLLKSFRRSRKKVCPEDRNPLRGDGGFFPDVAWKRDILSLRVKCKKTDRGCDWIGEIRQYKEHNRVCQYQDVVCDDCEQNMQRRLLGEHQTSECPNRIVQCEYCEKEFAFCRTEVHRGKCKRFPLDCPQLCEVKEIPREEMENHVKEDCLMTMVDCPYEKAGCTFHDKRLHLKAHLKAFIEEHLSKTWSELQKKTTDLDVLKGVEDEVVKLQDDNKSLKTSLHRKSNDIKKLEARNKTMNKKLTKVENQLEKVTRTAAENQRIIKLMKPRVLGTNSTSQSKRKRKYSPTESESSSSESESDDESSPRKSKRRHSSSASDSSSSSDSDRSDED